MRFKICDPQTKMSPEMAPEQPKSLPSSSLRDVAGERSK
ncbi:hypothetical protein VDGL01_11482 [Verticillium dahliae]